MKLTITTPAILFSTVSLLMVAYTTRFFGLAGLIRNLHDMKQLEHMDADKLHIQILLLKRRLDVIKYMQFCGVLALTFSVLSISTIYLEFLLLGEIFFSVALLLLLLSLVFSLVEIKESTEALKIALDECEGEGCTCKK